MEKLKLCPFCGSKAKIMTDYDESVVGCSNSKCFATVNKESKLALEFGIDSTSIHEFITIWNSRPL